MSFNRTQKVTLAIALIAVGYFAVHTFRKSSEPAGLSSIALHLLPDIDPDQPESQQPPVTQAALLFYNDSDQVDREISIDVQLPVIQGVRLNKPQRMKVTSGGENANFISVHVPELLPGELLTVLLEFAESTTAGTVEDWRELYGCPDDLEVMRLAKGQIRIGVPLRHPDSSPICFRPRFLVNRKG